MSHLVALSLLAGILSILFSVSTATTPYETFFSTHFNATNSPYQTLAISLTNATDTLYSSCHVNYEADATCSTSKSYFFVPHFTKLLTATLAIKQFTDESSSHQSALTESLSETLAKLHSLIEIPSEIIGNPHSYSALPKYSSPPGAAEGTRWEDLQVRDLILGTHGFDEIILGTSAPSQSDIVTDYEAFFGAEGRKAKVQRKLVRIRPRNEVSTDSNAAYTLLGHLVELSVGPDATFPQILREKLLTPLQMSTAKYNFDDSFLNDENYVKPKYPVRWEKGNAGLKEVSDYGQYLNMAPALGLYASVEDVNRFLRMQLNDGVAEDGTTILSLIQVAFLKRVAYRNGGTLVTDVGNAPPGFTLGGWFEGIYNGISYLYRMSEMHPYYATTVMFPQQKLGLTLQSTAAKDAPQRFTTVVQAFIREYIQPFKCADSVDLRYDPVRDKCYKVVKMSDLSAIPDSIRFNGCFSLRNYEHTTWFKIHHLWMPHYCTSAIKGARTVTVTGEDTFHLALDEKGMLRRGRLNDKNFEFDFPYQEAYGFKVASTDTKHENPKARYLYIDADVYESIFFVPNMWKAFFFLYFGMVLLCVVVVFCCCGNCLCIEGAVLHKQENSKRAYHALYSGEDEWIFEEDEENYLNPEDNYLEPYEESTEEERETSDDIKPLSQNDRINLSYSDDDDIHEIPLPDPGPTYKRSANTNPGRRKRLPHLSHRGRFALAGTVDVIAVGCVLITGILLLLHAVGMLVSVNIVNPLKLYSQQGASGLEFWLILPPICLGTTIISLLCFCCVSFNRLFMKPSVNGCVWIIAMAFCVILFAGYVPISAFWNFFGLSFSA